VLENCLRFLDINNLNLISCTELRVGADAEILVKGSGAEPPEANDI